MKVEKCKKIAIKIYRIQVLSFLLFAVLVGCSNKEKPFDVARATEQEIMSFMNQAPNFMGSSGKQKVDKIRDIFKKNGYSFSATLHKLSNDEFPCIQKLAIVQGFVVMFYSPYFIFDINDTEWDKLEKEGKIDKKLKSAGYSNQECKDLIKFHNRMVSLDPNKLPAVCE